MWRWVVAIGVAAFIFLVFWSNRKPPGPTLHEISWQLPRPVMYMRVCDLDGDGNQEVIVNTGAIRKGMNSEWWWLRPSLDGWKVIKVPGIVCEIHDWVYPVSDLDGDGKINDILVLKQLRSRSSAGTFLVRWFQIGEDGLAVLRDSIRLSLRGADLKHLLIRTESFWCERGKLVFKTGWEGVGNIDWDGDGLPELIRYCDEKLFVTFSKTREQCYFHLPCGIRDVTSADLDGDGARELVAITYTGIVLLDRQGKAHLIPFPKGYNVASHVSKLWITKGEKGEKLWMETFLQLWGLWKEGDKWATKSWGLQYTEIWQDQEGAWLAYWKSWSPYDHRFWRQIAKMLNKARSWGFPVPELRNKVHLQLMRWDEKQNDWQRFRSFYPNHFWLEKFIVLDMDGDGKSEWLILGLSPHAFLSSHYNYGGEAPLLLFYTGQLHRMAVHRMAGSIIYHRSWFVLRGKQRDWVVFEEWKSAARNPFVLKALTLKPSK